MTTFTLTLADGIDLTVTAEDSGQTWNGYAVPVLTAEQAETVGRALGETLTAGPAAGLTWERADVSLCYACGKPWTADNACEWNEHPTT